MTQEKIFKTLDINEDGSVSVDEMEKSKECINRFRSSRSEMNVTHILHDLDLNNDGLIQPNEIDDSLEWITKNKVFGVNRYKMAKITNTNQLGVDMKQRINLH